MRAILVATMPWRRAAALGLLALVAGATAWLIRRPQPLPPIPRPPARWVVGRVIEPYQGIAGAQVRLTALQPPAEDADPQARLAACDLHAGTLAVAHSGADGRFALPRSDAATTIQVRVGDQVWWRPLPAGDAPIALAYHPDGQRPLSVPIGGRIPDVPGLRVAAVYDDGHCAPLTRRGSTYDAGIDLPWVGHLLIAEPGHAPVLVANQIEDDRRVRPTAIDDCPLRIVDVHGRPIHRAVVQRWAVAGYQRELIDGYSDEDGLVCDLSMTRGGVAEITAPVERGGGCAARGLVWIPRDKGTAPRTVPLLEIPRHRSELRIRLLNGRGEPIPGATVNWWEARPGPSPLCGGSWDFRHSDLDGGLFVPDLLDGAVVLHVQHPWYRSRDVVIQTPFAQREVMLERGATWRGRVIGPDGTRVDAIVALRSGGALVPQKPLDGSFLLHGLPAGPGELLVQSEDDRLGHRTLILPVDLVADEDRRADVHWPRGEDIAGLVRYPRRWQHSRTIVAWRAGDTRKDAERQVAVEADIAGRFVFRHLPPGRWVISASPQTRREVPTGTRDLELAPSPQDAENPWPYTAIDRL